MKDSEVRIPKDIAADVFAVAANLYAQENHNYSLEELIAAGAEVQIPANLIQQALAQIKAKQMQARERQRKLKLILISGGTGAVIAFLVLSAYNTIASNITAFGRSKQNNQDYISANHQDTLDPKSLPPIFPKADDTTVTGVVKQYLLNPEGKVDGLLLNNGLQVKFPPHMGDSLVATVTSGTKVTISGKSGASTRFGQEVKAKSITTQTGQTLVAQRPAMPPQQPSSNYSNLSIEGTAQNWLVGHRGEINGIIVSNGAIVKFPPHVGNQLVNIANVGDKIKAQGFGTRNRYGQVIEATNLFINGQAISLEPKTIAN